MFNRVKSLIVSGVLVLGMAMPAFADGENPNWTADKCLIGDQVGVHDNKVHTIVDADIVTKEDFYDKVFTPITETKKDGLIIKTISEDGNKNGVYQIWSDKDYDDNIDESKDVLLETINIDFGDDVVTDKKWNPGITPGTGDTLALGGLAVAAVAAGGLTIVNKKRNK